MSLLSPPARCALRASHRLFFVSCYGDHCHLHSFPTRRSSDLVEVRGRDLTAELMGRLSFTEYFHLLLTGREPTEDQRFLDRKSTRLNSSHTVISYAVFCLKKKNLFLESRIALVDPDWSLAALA